jgi:hypothetical protein
MWQRVPHCLDSWPPRMQSVRCPPISGQLVGRALLIVSWPVTEYRGKPSRRDLHTHRPLIIQLKMLREELKRFSCGCICQNRGLRRLQNNRGDSSHGPPASNIPPPPAIVHRRPWTKDAVQPPELEPQPLRRKFDSLSTCHQSHLRCLTSAQRGPSAVAAVCLPNLKLAHSKIPT